jgi:hypothetical protein
LGVVWLEEPLPRTAGEHLAKLCDRMNCIRTVRICLAGGEGNAGLHEFRTLVEDNKAAKPGFELVPNAAQEQARPIHKHLPCVSWEA